MGWRGKPPTHFIPEVKADTVELTKKIENFIYRRVLIRSPVKSGAFQANHNRSVGSPDFYFDKDKTAGGQAQPPVKFGDKLYVANGAPYAARLENGWSTQAPAGTYRLATAAAFVKFRA